MCDWVTAWNEIWGAKWFAVVFCKYDFNASKAFCLFVCFVCMNYFIASSDFWSHLILLLLLLPVRPIQTSHMWQITFNQRNNSPPPATANVINNFCRGNYISKSVVLLKENICDLKTGWNLWTSDSDCSQSLQHALTFNCHWFSSKAATTSIFKLHIV